MVLDKVKPSAALAAMVKGVIVVHGGVTSHAAITARENNKPAVVGLPENFLEHVREGQMVELNGDDGIVVVN